MTEDFRQRAAEAIAASDLAPSDSALALEAAEMSLRAGMPRYAEKYAQRGVAADRGSARAHRVYSGVLDATGRRVEAIEAAYDAIAIDPDAAEFRLHLGGLLAAERRWSKAIEQLRTHIGLASPAPVAWRLLSSVYQQTGRLDEAIDAGRRARGSDPENTEYKLHLSTLLAARGLFDDALAELMDDTEDARLARARAEIHARLGDQAKALRAAERAMALDPDNPENRAAIAHVAGICGIETGDRAPGARVARRMNDHDDPPAGGGLGADIGERWRVIYAIMLREIRTRFGHTRAGYLWAILEPIGHLATLGLVFSLFNRAPPPVGEDLFLYYVTGLLPFLAFAHISQAVMQSADDGAAILRLPVVKRTDIMVAQALRQMATELCVGLLIFASATLLGYRGMPSDVLTALAAVTATGLLGLGVGAAGMTITMFWRSFDTIYAAVIRLLYFASGIYYAPVAMPDWVRDWLVWNPVLQVIEWFRAGFYPRYEPHWLNVDYLLLWVVASVGLGFTLERATRARMMVMA